MHEQLSLFAITPVIHYPREMQVGKTYLMTIDLKSEEGFEWQYEEEEYPIYCKAIGEQFNIRPIGDPCIVLHRFGGSYGEAKILITALQPKIACQIRVNLTNRWGISIKQIILDSIKAVQILPSISAKQSIRLRIPSAETQHSGELAEIDKLVKEVQEKTRSYILERCGMMQVLDMSRPLDVHKIFTDINIFEGLSNQENLSTNEMLKISQSENLGHHTFQQVRHHQQVSGLEAVKHYTKMMIFGKSGSGKTTFLKYIAIACNQSEILPNQVPLFLEFRDFHDQEEHSNLKDYIYSIFKNCGIFKEDVNKLLRSSRVVFLLDGLDALEDRDPRQVIKQLQDLAQDFEGNKFILTCRFGAYNYRFEDLVEDFVEVEICDLNNEQIHEFIQKWFSVKKSDRNFAKKFTDYIKKNKRIRELSTNPLLLTLLCMILEDSGDFPVNRTEIYQESVDVLLRKWDVSRNIQRPYAYRNLSKNKKEDLLSCIAYKTFKEGEYFFKLAYIEDEIGEYVKALPRSVSNLNPIEPEIHAILTSMMIQHGLIVEVAIGIYAFSHLTFHEYFASLKILKTLDPKEQREILSSLAEHIHEPRWSEIFLLVACMLPNADRLILAMKQHVDSLVASDNDLQTFLTWINEKTESLDNRQKYRKIGIHSFYFSLALDYKRVSAQVESLSSKLTNELSLDFELIKLLTDACNYELSSIELSQPFSLEPELQQGLKTLNDKLSNLSGNSEKRTQWWNLEGEKWIRDLRDLMIDCRNIGHDWQFSRKQIEKLKQYQDSSKLILECLNGDCYISRSAREEIMNTFFISLR